MTKTTHFRRLLAMLVSIAVLASCLAVAGIQVSAATTVWDFENEAVNGTNLSLYTSDSMKVTNEKNHTSGGGKSLKLETAQTAGGARAQTFIKDGAGNIVTVAQGEILTVSIWVYVPAQDAFTNASKSENRNTLRLWLTATESNSVYTSGGQKDAEVIYENTNTSGLEHNIPVDTWHKITVTTNGAHAGKVRMGLCASNQGNKITFYADDITVVRDDPEPTPTVTGTAYNYKFDVNNGQYWSNAAKTAPYFTTPSKDSHNQSYGNGAQSQIVADGNGYAMEVAYIGNREDTADTQRYAGFTLPNTYDEAKNGRNPGQTVHLEVGSAFKVTVKYKVTGYASPATLYAAVYKGVFCGLTSDKSFESHYSNRSELARITGTTGEQTVSAILAPNNKDAFTIFLKMDDDTNRVGTKLLITEVDIQPVAAGTIKFDMDGGTPMADLVGAVGDDVVLPADPSRTGYTFQGWTTTDGSALPTKFTSATVTLKASWLPAHALVMDAEDLTVGDPIQINTTGDDVASASTDYNHTNGGTNSIKITGKVNSRERTQFFVKADGQQVALEAGKDYKLSFWYYIPANAGATNLKYWFSAGDSTTAYSNADDVTFFNERINVSDKTIENPAKGVWNQVTVDVDNNVRVGDLRIGVCGTTNPYTIYVDDIVVYEVLPFVSDANTMDFENDALGTDLNFSAYNGQSAKVSAEYNHTVNGGKSLKFEPKSQGGGTRPQIMVKDGNGAQVMVEAGKSYELTFWLYVPETEGNYTVNYWWAACDNDTAFADGAAKDAAKIYESGVATEGAGIKGAWTQVTTTVESSKSGKLRLGLCGSDSNSKNRIFYVDDVYVKETIPYVQDPEVESFESYAAGTKLSINTSTSSITVSADKNATIGGAQSALVTSMTKAGAARAQMLVKDGLGQQIVIEKDKSYNVTFQYFLPDDQPDVNMNFWFAAANGEAPFATGDEKNAAVLYEYTAPTGTASDTKGVWIDVSVNLVNCQATGNLRFGPATSVEGKVLFYVDEIKVTELDVDLSFDPDATVYDFENYITGTPMTNFVRGDGAISDEYNHTPGGKNSLAVTKLTNSGLERSQMILLDPATGEPYEFKVGQSYTISMWVYSPYTNGDLFAFNLWMLGTDNLAQVANKDKAEYDMGSWSEQIGCDEWFQFKQTITIANGKYLILGMTNHGADSVYGSKFYVDDIMVEEPQYMTVQFDTNGSEDKIEPLRCVIGLTIPFEADIPYRKGYKFSGWFTDKSCEPRYFFDIDGDVLRGKDGDVLTLYAGWEEWEIFEDDGPIKELEDKYELQYTEEKVWVDREPEILDLGDAPEAEVETLVDTPDNDVKTDPVAQEGLPTWLIIVIIIGGVLVVGGGAVAALLLSKKKPEIDA